MPVNFQSGSNQSNPDQPIPPPRGYYRPPPKIPARPQKGKPLPKIPEAIPTGEYRPPPKIPEAILTGEYRPPPKIPDAIPTGVYRPPPKIPQKNPDPPVKTTYTNRPQNETTDKTQKHLPQKPSPPPSPPHPPAMVAIDPNYKPVLPPRNPSPEIQPQKMPPKRVVPQTPVNKKDYTVTFSPPRVPEGRLQLNTVTVTEVVFLHLIRGLEDQIKSFKNKDFAKEDMEKLTSELSKLKSASIALLQKIHGPDFEKIKTQINSEKWRPLPLELDPKDKTKNYIEAFSEANMKNYFSALNAVWECYKKLDSTRGKRTESRKLLDNLKHLIFRSPKHEDFLANFQKYISQESTIQAALKGHINYVRENIKNLRPTPGAPAKR